MTRRFLVGQRHPLARAERGKGGVEPGRADDRVDHDVDVGNAWLPRPERSGPVGNRDPPLPAASPGKGRPPLGHLLRELFFPLRPPVSATTRK